MPGRSVPPRTGPLVDPGIEALWAHVLDHWEDDKAHAAFLQQCDQLNQLPEAATRYRGMAGDHTRAEVAEKKLKAVAVLAMAKLESHRTAPPGGQPVVVTILALLFVGAAALAVAHAYGAL